MAPNFRITSFGILMILASPTVFSEQHTNGTEELLASSTRIHSSIRFPPPRNITLIHPPSLHSRVLKTEQHNRTLPWSFPPDIHPTNSPLTHHSIKFNITKQPFRPRHYRRHGVKPFIPTPGIDLNTVNHFMEFVPLDYENGAAGEHNYTNNRKRAAQRRSGPPPPASRRNMRISRRNSTVHGGNPTVFKRIITNFHERVARMLLGRRRGPSITRHLPHKINQKRVDFVPEEDHVDDPIDNEVSQLTPMSSTNEIPFDDLHAHHPDASITSALHNMANMIQSQSLVPVVQKRERIRKLTPAESQRLDSTSRRRDRRRFPRRRYPYKKRPRPHHHHREHRDHYHDHHDIEEDDHHDHHHHRDHDDNHKPFRPKHHPRGPPRLFKFRNLRFKSPISHDSQEFTQNAGLSPPYKGFKSFRPWKFGKNRPPPPKHYHHDDGEETYSHVKHKKKPKPSWYDNHSDEEPAYKPRRKPPPPDFFKPMKSNPFKWDEDHDHEDSPPKFHKILDNDGTVRQSYKSKPHHGPTSTTSYHTEEKLPKIVINHHHNLPPPHPAPFGPQGLMQAGSPLLPFPQISFNPPHIPPMHYHEEFFGSETSDIGGRGSHNRQIGSIPPMASPGYTPSSAQANNALRGFGGIGAFGNHYPADQFSYNTQHQSYSDFPRAFTSHSQSFNPFNNVPHFNPHQHQQPQQQQFPILPHHPEPQHSPVRSNHNHHALNGAKSMVSSSFPSSFLNFPLDIQPQIIDPFAKSSAEVNAFSKQHDPHATIPPPPPPPHGHLPDSYPRRSKHRKTPPPVSSESPPHTHTPLSAASREQFFNFDHPRNNEDRKSFQLTLQKSISSEIEIPRFSSERINPNNPPSPEDDFIPPIPPKPIESIFDLGVPDREAYKRKKQSSSKRNKFNNLIVSKESSAENKISDSEQGYSTLPDNWNDFRPDPSHTNLPKLTYDELEANSRMYKLRTALTPKGIMKAIMSRFPRAQKHLNRAHTKFTHFDAVSKESDMGSGGHMSHVRGGSSENGGSRRIVNRLKKKYRKKGKSPPSSIQDIINSESTHVHDSMPHEDDEDVHGLVADRKADIVNIMDTPDDHQHQHQQDPPESEHDIVAAPPAEELLPPLQNNQPPIYENLVGSVEDENVFSKRKSGMSIEDIAEQLHNSRRHEAVESSGDSGEAATETPSSLVIVGGGSVSSHQNSIDIPVGAEIHMGR